MSQINTADQDEFNREVAELEARKRAEHRHQIADMERKLSETKAAVQRNVRAAVIGDLKVELSRVPGINPAAVDDAANAISANVTVTESGAALGEFGLPFDAKSAAQSYVAGREYLMRRDASGASTGSSNSAKPSSAPITPETVEAALSDYALMERLKRERPTEWGAAFAAYLSARTGVKVDAVPLSVQPRRIRL